ncbi:MAG: triose-phosphate isomerase [bacterium]
MKKKYFFANWKMYLNNSESIALASWMADNSGNFDKNFELAVFPTNLSLVAVKNRIKESNIKIGAQNSYWLNEGGYTGEVSVGMLKEVGCSYVLVGHSERRHLFNETNEQVGKKISSAVLNNMIPVLCVGETKQQREDNYQEIIVKKQIEEALSNIDLNEISLFIAYEPVWAVGSGKNCSLFEAEQMHDIIGKIVGQFSSNYKILYGGSVRPENINEYIQSDIIDGVLVGGASTKKDALANMLGMSNSI